MEAKTLAIYNTEGKEVESIKLDSSIFDGIVNMDAIHQVTTAYSGNQRKGLASTKTRGEVSGGGKKPWKQKGTGRARVGSTRSPLWRHGGVIFGPHPKSFYIAVPRKLKLIALRSVLNAKVNENNLIVLDELKISAPKTKEAAKILNNLKIASGNRKSHSALLLLDKIDTAITKSFRNIDFLTMDTAKDTNAYNVLKAHKLITTKKGLKELSSRIKK